MNKKMLYQRINEEVPVSVWWDLNDICVMIGSSSKTLVKTTLFAMDNVEQIQVEMDTTPINNPKNVKWKWMFRRSE